MDERQKSAQKPGDVVEATDSVSVGTDIVEDHTDIRCTQSQNREHPQPKHKSLLRFDPGLVTRVAILWGNCYSPRTPSHLCFLYRRYIHGL